jgi:8-oxo-(d)GTP phosphatase
MATQPGQAAGGAVWRIRDGGAEVAVVHRPRRDDWSLPKGRPIRGEHPLVTACREVAEETGIRPVPGPRLPTQRYRSSAGPKVVHYWAMSGRAAGRFVPTAEVDQTAWLPIAEARSVLSYRRDVTVLDTLTRAMRVDAVVLLVRHTGEGRGERGAKARGRRALALRHVLPSFAPDRLLSVPDKRRGDTLAPLAARLGLPVLTDLELTGRRRNGAGDPRRVRDLAAAGGTTVVAASGPVIRGVVTDLARADLARGDRVALARIRAGKGSVWALFFSGARLASADYYPNLNDSYG